MKASIKHIAKSGKSVSGRQVYLVTIDVEGKRCYGYVEESN